MKRLLTVIIALLAMQFHSYAQFAPAGATTGNIYNTNSGNVGIGVSGTLNNAANKLEVRAPNGDGIRISGAAGEASANLFLYPSSASTSKRNWVISAFHDNLGDFVIRSSNSSTASPYTTTGTTRFTIRSNGNVGIGTLPGDNTKLAVEGLIGAREVRVLPLGTAWPDYVFSNTYKLRPLTEVAQFINENKHLPDVPSAGEVEKDGLLLGEMNATLLKKIEELTLYMIDQNKQLQELKKENELLKNKVSNLENK